MRRLLIALALCVTWAASASAQTTVNLTVTDTPDNQLWTNGTWAVKLQQAAGDSSQTGSFVLLSGGGSLANQTGSLSGTATAAIVLPANANIGPGGTKWQFTVCPQASAGCFQQAVTVSTSSPQTLAINPPSIRINLATATPPISAYATGEITGAVIGSQFFLIGTGAQFCSTVVGNACTVWVAAGGGGIPSVSSLPGGAVIYVATSCPIPALNCVVVKNDWQFNWLCSWANASPTITCPSGTFVAGDVGKRLVATNSIGFTSYATAVVQCGNASNITITTFTDSAHVNISQNCTVTSSANTAVYWGTSDDTAMNTASALLGVVAGTLQLPCTNAQGTGPSMIGISSAKFITLNSSANSLNAASASRQGITVQGCGTNSSYLFMLPEFDPTTCTGGAGAACFGYPISASKGGLNFINWTITGGGNSNPINSFSGKIGVQMGANSTLRDFYALGFAGKNVSGFIGVDFNANGNSGPILAHDFQSDGFGNLNCQVTVAFVTFSGEVYCGDGANQSLYVPSGSLVDNGGIYGPNSVSGSINGCTAVVNIAGGTARFVGSLVNQNTTAATEFCNQSGKLYLDGVDGTTAGASGDSLFHPSGSTGTTWIRDSILNASNATGITIACQGGTIVNSGGNTISSGAAGPWNVTTNCQKIQADGHSLTGACTGVVTASQTLGLFGTGPNVTLTTCTSTTVGSGVVIQSARTMMNLVASSTAGGVNASSGVVTVLKNGVATTITCTIGTGTFCGDGVHTVALVQGDLISIQFTSQAADTLAGVKAFVEWDGP